MNKKTPPAAAPAAPAAPLALTPPAHAPPAPPLTLSGTAMIQVPAPGLANGAIGGISHTH